MISFHRQWDLQVLVGGDVSWISFSVGVSKEVDTQSGMTVNLVEVDNWYFQSKASLQSSKKDWFDFLKFAEMHFFKLAQAQGAILKQVQVQLESKDQLQLNQGAIVVVRHWFATDLKSQNRHQIGAQFKVQNQCELDSVLSCKLPSELPPDLAHLFDGMNLKPEKVYISDSNQQFLGQSGQVLFL